MKKSNLPDEKFRLIIALVNLLTATIRLFDHQPALANLLDRVWKWPWW